MELCLNVKGVIKMEVIEAIRNIKFLLLLTMICTFLISMPPVCPVEFWSPHISLFAFIGILICVISYVISYFM